MRNFQHSYSKYFNLKNDRTGGLFQAMFKAVRIETDEQLIHVSRYIHLNPVSSMLIKIEKLEDYLWSSFKDYILDTNSVLISPVLILKYFKSKNKYKEFVFNQADYQKRLESIKHLTLDVKVSAN